MTNDISTQRMQRIEELIAKLDSVADPQVRAYAVELLQTLMELHRDGFDRALEIVADTNDGLALIDRLGEDSLVGGLLLLYGLHPVDFETRVRQALDKVRPYLNSHGGNVELTAVENGVIRLQMQGSCHGCPSSAMTLKLAIEDAIYEAAPDTTEILVDGVVEQKQSGLVPLQRMRKPAEASAETWKEVEGLTSLAQGTVKALEINGEQVVFCRLNGDFYAYASNCSLCGKPLASAHLEQKTLVCPHCGERFDLSLAGRSLNRADLQLQPFPLLMEGGLAKIALPQPA